MKQKSLPALLQRFCRSEYCGLIAWSAMISGIVLFTMIAPNSRTVTVAYRFATDAFLRQGPIYPAGDGAVVDGFLYLPGFVALFLPFDLAGSRIGDSLWKACGALLLVYAAWRNCREIDGQAVRRNVVSLALLLAVPTASASVLNGQSNIHLAAACWLAILCALTGRYIELALWIGIAVLAKPIAIVVVLLIAAIAPRSIPALLCGLGWAAALPFGLASPNYVIALYQQCWTMLTDMAQGERAMAADFTGVVHRLGWTLGLTSSLLIRSGAAVLTWASAAASARKLRPNAAALAVTVAAMSYMCLFNPRAENVTYSIIAVPYGAVVALHLVDQRVRPLWIAETGLLVILGFNGVSAQLAALTAFWFKPVVTLTILTLMIADLMVRRETWQQTFAILDRDDRTAADRIPGRSA